MSLITMTDPVKFNTRNILAIAGVTLKGTSTYRAPKRVVNNFSLANTDGSVTTSSFKEGRIVNVAICIARPNRESLDETLDELNDIIEPINKVLELPIRGSAYQFRSVTLNNIMVKDVQGGYCDVDLEFLAGDPYSYSLLSYELLNVHNLGSGSKSYPLVIDGKGKQQPVLTFTLDTKTGGSEITIGNPVSDQFVTVDRTWAAADVLIIDVPNKTVKINGTAVEFTGMFPEWEEGNGFLNYTDDFSSRQVDINLTYYKRYR